MTIEFRCSNQVTDSSGTASACNQLLKADSQHIGKQVRCPKCQQLTTIPAKAETSQPTASHARPEQGAAAPSHPLPTGDDAGSQQLKFGKFDPFVRCPECGSMLDKQKKCTKCRYSQRQSKSDELPLNEMKVKPAGFILFLRKKLARDLSPAVITAVCFLMLFLVCFILLSLAFCALGWWGLVVIPMLMALVIVSMIVYLKIREMCTRPGAELAFWQKPLWDLILGVIRGSNWNTKYVPKSAPVVDLRDNPPSDQDLFMLPELTKCSVLDLEGAPITDAGLVALRGLSRLKYLNLKNTQVTTEGVFRLQQSNLETWIWY